MKYQKLLDRDRGRYDQVVKHPLQSWEWGEFREKTGVKVVRQGLYKDNNLVGGFSLTIHPLPHLPWSIGYLPKGIWPDETLLTELTQIGKENNCLFIKLEPNVEKGKLRNGKHELRIGKYTLQQSPHPLFTRHTFEIDLTKTEDELLAQMQSKTRYNVRLAQRKGAVVKENHSPEAFSNYLELTFETTKRQQFFAHTQKYHQLMWETLSPNGIAHLLIASLGDKILVTWIVFLYNRVLYYPYGASSNEHREVMASNLMMWEAMRWGKAQGARIFDLWGSLGPDADPKDHWYGFHRFKEGYSPRSVEWVGSFDLVLNQNLYTVYNLVHQMRGLLLQLKAKLR